jgi:hypothetical protein
LGILIAIEPLAAFADRPIDLPEPRLHLIELSARPLPFLLAPRPLQLEHAELEVCDMALATPGCRHRRPLMSSDH